MLSIEGFHSCTTDRNTRSTTSKEIPGKLVIIISSVLLLQPQIWTFLIITPAYLPDCGSKFIEIVLEVLRLRTAPLYHLPKRGSQTPRAPLFRISRQCIARAPSTCRLPFAASLASRPPGFLPQPFLHSLFFENASIFSAEFSWSPSIFSTPSNSFAMNMITDSLFKLSLQLLTQVFSLPCVINSNLSID